MAAHPQEPDPELPAGMPNLKFPTMGGKQLWTDHAWRQGWRIQRNAVTGHWRLLDDKNVRHAWGSRTSCQAALEQLQPDNSIHGPSLTILLHGLMRTSKSMSKLGQHLSEQTESEIAYFEYASSRSTITDHAAALRDVVANLPADTQLNFIGHSMGNIVVRHAIGDWQRADDQATLSRIQHVVMIGPPNHGASIARQLAKTGMFKLIFGAGGMQLGPEWQAFEAQLATPGCPFGIVAGRLPESGLRNPLVEGGSDFVVSVEETKLDGATDFLEVPTLHSYLMDDPVVQAAIVHFLDHQSFQAEP